MLVHMVLTLPPTDVPLDFLCSQTSVWFISQISGAAAVAAAAAHCSKPHSLAHLTLDCHFVDNTYLILRLLFPRC